MLMNKKEDFTPGTVVFLSDGLLCEPCFAVVFDEQFWIHCANQENPETVKRYKEHKNLLVPVRILGRRIGVKHDRKIEPDDSYIQHYTYGQMQIVSIKETVDWLNRLRQFNEVNTEYFNSVLSDIEILKMHLNGKYEFLNIPADRLFHIFVAGIPI